MLTWGIQMCVMDFSKKAKMRLHIKYIKCRRVLSSVPCKNYKSVCAILPISFWFMSSCNFCSFYVFFEGTVVVVLMLLLFFLFYYILFFVAISCFSYFKEKYNVLWKDDYHSIEMMFSFHFFIFTHFQGNHLNIIWI